MQNMEKEVETEIDNEDKPLVSNLTKILLGAGIIVASLTAGCEVYTAYEYPRRSYHKVNRFYNNPPIIFYNPRTRQHSNYSRPGRYSAPRIRHRFNKPHRNYQRPHIRQRHPGQRGNRQVKRGQRRHR